LQADARCSLCIEALAPVAVHVSVDGIAEPLLLPDFDLWPISHRLAEKYLGGPEGANTEAVEMFFANMQTEPRLLFKLVPDTTRAIDMRVYRGKRANLNFQEQHDKERKQ